MQVRLDVNERRSGRRQRKVVIEKRLQSCPGRVLLRQSYMLSLKHFLSLFVRGPLCTAVQQNMTSHGLCPILQHDHTRAHTAPILLVVQVDNGLRGSSMALHLDFHRSSSGHGVWKPYSRPGCAGGGGRGRLFQIFSWTSRAVEPVSGTPCGSGGSPLSTSLPGRGRRQCPSSPPLVDLRRLFLTQCPRSWLHQRPSRAQRRSFEADLAASVPRRRLLSTFAGRLYGTGCTLKPSHDEKQRKNDDKCCRQNYNGYDVAV